jgi:acyl dehydratase
MRGLYFEEFEVGKIHKHSLSRTVTEMDNILFNSLTMNFQAIHVDEEAAKKSVYGQRIVNSLFTVGLITAFSIMDLTQGTTLGNLGFEKITFPNPVFHGDTLRSETKILDKRSSNSRTDSGIVWFEHIGYNQRNEVVCSCVRVGLMALQSTDEASD